MGSPAQAHASLPPATRQTRRSDTSITIFTCSISRRRRAGLGIPPGTGGDHCSAITSHISRGFSFSRYFSHFTESRSTAPNSARQRYSVASDTPSDRATSVIVVPFAKPSSACLGLANNYSVRCCFLFEGVTGDASRSLRP